MNTFHRLLVESDPDAFAEEDTRLVGLLAAGGPLSDEDAAAVAARVTIYADPGPAHAIIYEDGCLYEETTSRRLPEAYHDYARVVAAHDECRYDAHEYAVAVTPAGGEEVGVTVYQNDISQDAFQASSVEAAVASVTSTADECAAEAAAEDEREAD